MHSKDFFCSSSVAVVFSGSNGVQQWHWCSAVSVVFSRGRGVQHCSVVTVVFSGVKRWTVVYNGGDNVQQ